MKVKICGMRDMANINAVLDLGPDYMGFIFYKESPRYVGDDFSVRESDVTANVGVFVNESTGVILKKLLAINSEIAQLHGNETPMQCDDLKSRGIIVIKAFSIDDSFDFKTLEPYKDVVDYFLFDTKGKLYGGNAKVFNWDKLKEYDQSVPFFLSGGLNPENVRNISGLDGLNIYAIDLNSGVELEPGKKSVEKIREVMKALDIQ
ncbi:MAG TPA: phosphoribosylanthranilate isomerase [Cyclobacteriaceae bacterium]|nr:phosphoribosylanthranilate isomerase [Cyclobacteriaceae bacterium]